MKSYDITIIGSGIVGLTAACLLAENPSLRIAVIESNPASVTPNTTLEYDARVSAISLASQRIFQHLKIWHAITAARGSPYQRMQVWDASNPGEISFDHTELNERVLGYIIEDRVMRSALQNAREQHPNIDFLCPLELTALHPHADYIELITKQNETIQTKLLIAADGAHSWVRQTAGIETQSWDYQHSAIVATVKTTAPHAATARQVFLPTGPLAFLPLSDAHHCSIVWSAIPEEAERLFNLEDATFCEELAKAFDHKLGAITKVSPRFMFPLRMRHAKTYIKPRIALIGDAAHTIHPLAGQGVNLGLLDAACLAEVIHTALLKKRDFSSTSTLRRYERWRKGENLLMIAVLEGLKHLFQSDARPVQQLRTSGLSFVNRLLPLKNFLAQHAMGQLGDLPKIACYRSTFTK